MNVLIALGISLILMGCAVKGPVTSASVVDDRPRISFEIKDYKPAQLELFIDNVSYGTVERYLADNDSGAEAALPILPGKHKIELRTTDTIVFEKIDYFAEGMLRIFKVTP